MMDYLGNLLGALAVSVRDRLDNATADVAPHGGQLAEALVLLEMRPGTSIKRLAERLRLSHPGAVRLVDRLEAQGWATRSLGADRRSVRLSLTASGQGELDRLRRTRAAHLADLLDALTEDERQALQPIVEKLLRRLTVDLVTAYANCRLCDTPMCEARGCPVEAEARARFTPTTSSQAGDL